MAAPVTFNAGVVRELPRSAYDCAGNVCVGKTPEVAGYFAGVQRGLNALARNLAGLGELRVTVDGKIGPQTVAAVKKAFATVLPGQPIPNDSNTVAQMAPMIAAEFFARAGVVADYSPPGAAPRPGQLPQPLVPAPDAPGVQRAGFGIGWWIAGAALLAGAGFLIWKSVKGGDALSGADGADDFDYEEAVEDFIDV